MNMIPVSPNLDKLDLIALFNLNANFLENPIDFLIKYRTSVFRGKHQVVQQHRNIVTLVQILAHASILRHAASGGELNPE